MKEVSAQAGETGAAGLSPADEMDIGLLRRGDGKLSIVGLGGSAGSIAALQEFFAAMPVDSGMAFVVILHLSSHHESTLAEMFQRSTAMPVVPATDGVTVEANCVYVIPPGKFLASVDGHLSLSDAHEPRGKRVAVDYFFRTLAETHGAHALAVLFSGAGGDGALGLKRIKELGGLTIAQDPDEAEHPDMPRSAIATGVVDWVLGVKEMPAKLIAYVKQRGELKLPAEEGPHPATKIELSPDEHEAALRDVLAFLHMRTGRDFSCYKRATILRRIARRMQVNGLADLPGYLVYLRTHAGEAGALLQDLLISVTNFFRDPASFAALERAIPQLFKGKEAGDTVRVWVAGCATGEEAYSIAMLLSEHAASLVGPPQIQVFATDLDEEIIREAREGLYPETIAADVSEERLRHFFIHEQGGFRVRRAVRELVLFAPHDLLKDSPFSRLDLVSCRNLLIYLNREAQNRAFEIFHFALRSCGWLFLGTSEAVDEDSPLFAVLDKRQRLYVQRPGPQRLIAVPAGPGTLARALALQERTRERPTVPGRVTGENMQAGLDLPVAFDSALPPGELHYRLIERFSPPSILVNAAHEIIHLSESAGRFLQFSGGEPTRNLLRMVHPMLRVELHAALYAAAQTRTVATALRVPVETVDARSLVDIRVTPAGELAPDFLLVVFEEHPADGSAALAAPKNAHADQAALHLERELVATKAHLRDTIEESEASTEELKASNEELQAMNEELRSATEELETSREELQSINEELTTVNDELKSSVDQLARSNNDLQNLMAATDIATVFLDRELRIQRFTPSAKALFNFISADLGRPLSDLSRQLDYEEIVADAERALAHLQSVQREVRAGEHLYLARILPYRTADDRIAGVVLTFTDITTVKQGEDATARLAAIVESSSDAIIGKDLRGIVTSWNAGAQKVFGYTAAEMIGQPVTRLIPADRQAEEVEILGKIGAGETINSFDTVRVRKDGTTVAISATISPIKDAAGKIIGGSKIARDITEQKKAEQQLREGKEQLDFALAAADLGQWSMNLADRTARRNVRHDQLFGYDTLQPQWTYEMFLQHVVAEDRAAVDAAFHEAVATGSAWAVECRIRRADGAVRHIWTKALIRRGAEDQVEWMLGIVRDVTDRRQVEESLRVGQQRLRMALSAARMVAWEYDPTTGAVVTSDNASDVYGFRAGEAMANIDRGFALLHPDDVDRHRAAVAAAVASGDGFISQFRIVRPDTGAVQWMEERGHAVRDGADGTVRLVGVNMDITARQEAAAALRQSEERSAFVRRSSGVGFWYCDLPFDVLQWDDLVKTHFHLPPDAAVTIQTFYDRIHPDDREPTRQAIERSIAQRSQYDMEYRTVNPDTGAVKWVRAIGRTSYAADGTPTRFDGVTLDISEQKRAEASLRESEQRFRLVADAAPVLIWLSGTDKLCAWFNQPWLDFTGRSMAQEVGNGWVEGVHPDDLDRCLQTYAAAFDARAPFSMEYRLRRHDGEFRWLIDNGVPRYGPDGEFDGYIGSCLDVTDYKSAETALREADRRKDEFLATLAHELRNPLAPIRNGLQVIRMAGAAGTVEQARSMMERQLVQMTRLVDDLLDVSRVTAGKLELRRERLDLRAVITAALETSRPVIEQHRHDLVVVVPEEPIFVHGDPIRLAQVVSNLLTNSAKYTHRGGHIRLSVARDDGTAVLAVADDGIGIPTQMLQTVFGMFAQVDRTLEKTTGGLGVGLSLAKGVVEMHGGTIEARSEGEGKGSEFAVRLPVAAGVVNESTPSDAEANRVETASARRILIVDDNADAADSLGQLLEMMGNEVLTAYDGESGIKAARGFKPDVVLCDIGMPKMNGYDTARSMRAEEWGKKTVLLALSGWGQEDDLRKSMDAGFDHHLIKPVEAAALIKLLGGLQPQTA